MYVIKRDGTQVPFDKIKIINAINKAFVEVDGILYEDDTAISIAEEIEYVYYMKQDNLTIENIQDLVEEKLMQSERPDVAKAYIRYRYRKEMLREADQTYQNVLELVEFKNEELKDENSNKNVVTGSTQRDYMAGEVSKTLTNKYFLPKEISEAHNEGVIHFHDADYFAQRIHNCDVWNLDDMLQNGTVISGTRIEKPHSFSTACNIATQIMAGVASSQYGGQTITLTHLAPFVEVSRQKIRTEVEEEQRTIFNLTHAGQLVAFSDSMKAAINTIVEDRVKEEVKKGVQIIQYQINTLMTTNGQTPFASIFMYLGEARTEQEKYDLALIIEEVLKQRIQGVKNEKGVWVAPTFPKLLYVLEEDNIKEDSPYYYLTQLAAECTAKRMVPDYISEKIMKRDKMSKGKESGNGDCYPCMGCRSFLTPDRSGNGWDNIANALNYEPNKPKYYGRFNQGVVTINLAYAALEAEGNLDKFWDVLDKYLELCHQALQIRHKRLKGTPSDIAPILWQHGALARLEKGEPIDKLLYGGYSTISLGYAALWECVYALIHKKLTEPEGEELGLAIMQKLNDYTNKWKEEEDIDYSLYGTPLESTTYKFAKALKRRFGIIEGVSDKNYVTNSYHIHVTEKIDAFTKLATESKFQRLSPGGMISYIEVPNMQKNIEAVLDIIKFIYDNILYAELNTKLDNCLKCGYIGEIEIKESKTDGKLFWECPNCGNRDQNHMSVIRRTCGYLGANYWNQGRTQEINERTLHL